MSERREEKRELLHALEEISRQYVNDGKEPTKKSEMAQSSRDIKMRQIKRELGLDS